MGKSHPRCRRPDGHVCQEPSGRTCIEDGCGQPAGTRWGPYWCPEHDAERLDRISASLQEIALAATAVGEAYREEYREESSIPVRPQTTALADYYRRWRGVVGDPAPFDPPTPPRRGVPGVNCYDCGRFVGADGRYDVEGGDWEHGTGPAVVGGRCGRCGDREATEGGGRRG